MKLICPICGPRDLREFTVIGSLVHGQRPEGDIWSEAWHNHLHLRENPAGRTQELWWHHAGCGAWLVVERNTITHEIYSVTLASEHAA